MIAGGSFLHTFTAAKLAEWLDAGLTDQQQQQQQFDAQPSVTVQALA